MPCDLSVKPEALIEIAFYINGRNDEPGDGVYRIDDIKALQSSEPGSGPR